MRARNRLYLSLLVSGSFLLSGCDGPANIDELQNWMDEVRARPGGPLPPVPEIAPYERYVFQGSDEDARDPFRPFNFVKQDRLTPAEVGLTDAIKQELARNREELEGFELDGLLMVGHLQKGERYLGIVKAPDGYIYQVSIGNYMGKNLGKIIDITEDAILLREIFRNESSGRWEEREARLVVDSAAG